MARRTWPDCARGGYGLSSVCARLGHEFRHHHALEDAKAAAQILLAAMAETGLDLDGALRLIRQPVGGGSSGRTRRDSDPNGPLYGEVVVFTGALELPRAEAADVAAKLGCAVAPGVTRNTTLLVVGDTDVKRQAGHEKSLKHRKAEDLIARGVPIRIIREADFQKLFALA